MKKIDTIIYEMVEGDNKFVEGDNKFGFIEKFKTILPFILEDSKTNIVNEKEIKQYLDNISLKASPKKAKEKLIEYTQKREEINFFIPWGFRYYTDNMNINIESPEYESLERLKEKLLILKRLGVKFKLNFMCADSYATDINKCDPNLVNKYFINLEKILNEFFKDDINYDIFNYSEITKGQIYKNFKLDKSKISNKQKEKLEKQSNTLGSNWKGYVKSRQFEGKYIKMFLKNSIKISFASQMDDEFDGNLLSLYILDKEDQKPWVKIKD